MVKRDNEPRLINTSSAQLTGAGVPAIIIESGRGGQIEHSAVNDRVTGNLRALRSLGLIDGRSEEDPNARYASTTLNATVGHGGPAWPLRSLLEEVSEGEPVAEIRDVFRRQSSVQRAPCRWIALPFRTNPRVNSWESGGCHRQAGGVRQGECRGKSSAAAALTDHLRDLRLKLGHCGQVPRLEQVTREAWGV